MEHNYQCHIQHKTAAFEGIWKKHISKGRGGGVAGVGEFQTTTKHTNSKGKVQWEHSGKTFSLYKSDWR